MKTKNLSIISFCFIVIGLFACRKEYNSFFSENPDNKLKWAKDYFNNTLLSNAGNLVIYKKLSSTIATSATLADKAKNVKTPIWFKAKEGKTLLYDFVEVPLRYTKKLSRSVGTSTSVDKEALKASFDRLIIYKDKSGKIGERIVSYIPDREYLLRHKGDASHNSINNLDKDFTGYLRYSNWDGTPLFILRINNGKATKMAAPSIKELNSSRTILGQKAASSGNGKVANNYDDCTFIIETVYEQTCYFDSPEDTEPAYCDEPVVISETIVDMICPSDPGDPCADPANFGTGDCEIVEPEIDLDPLIKNLCDGLSEAQKTIIQNTVNSLKDYDCATKYMYNHFVNNNKSFNFCISPGQGSGTYSPTTKTFNFTSDVAAGNMYVVEHEFIHAFQDDSHPGGTGQYGIINSNPNAGFVDIEFEQAVMNDMINPGQYFAFNAGTQAQKESYKDWVDLVTNNGTTYPKLNPTGTAAEIAVYNTFMSSYNSFLSAYNAIPGNTNHSAALNLSPKALINLFNNINRNCP